MAKSKRASAQIVSPVLKCRKGDLAIRLDENFEGQIVEIVEYIGRVDVETRAVLANAWQILHPTYDPDYHYFCEDKYLLPIRPGDLEETESDELSLEGRG
ncbi:hypothetical protein [Nitrosospira sp. Nsp13]|uniref:hypothetical protein n=1 Tax=Nitrosospira sp. Nsp13 TaxID=1855332 RepID=UPI00088F73A2|nr:hypothetical protein [Nitrosospira sp. Nsp13]SCX76933.1 hypothetical protein SAMN05216308_10176 [Nitrosospira sp. Nsp13]